MGHIAGREHRSLWVISSFLLALGLVWSRAVMDERAGGGSWDSLRLGVVVALAVALLPLGPTFMFARRRRRAQKEDERAAEGDGGAEPGADGQPAGETPTEEHPVTYGEIFGGIQLGPDEGSSAPAPEDEEPQAEGGEGTEIEAEGQPPSDETKTEEEAPTSEEDVQTIPPDLDGGAEVEAIQADLETQESLRRMREQFAARAKEAELRIKQREAELHEVPSAPTSTQ